MKNILLTTLTWFIISCSNSQKKEQSYTVSYFGALKNMMHKGDISAKVDLSKFKGLEHLYALGAIENLKGEIQVFDGLPFNTRVIDSTLHFDNTFSKGATLLVYAQVKEWSAINIPETIKTTGELEDFVKTSAKKKGININRPFPFLIEGQAKIVNWHVINWKDDDKVHTHEKHKNSGLRGELKKENVTMLGFYSNAHHAIFTHHSTNMHIHVKNDKGTIAGHVDDLTIGSNMNLKLPKL